MRLLTKAAVVLAVLLTIGAASYKPAVNYWRTRNQPDWRQSEVVRGRIVSVRNATGTIKPVLQVSVGSFVSGPITELYADFNDEVKKGDLLAKIDPRLFEAVLARDNANFRTQEAEVRRVQAQLQQARNDERRARTLQAQNPNYISQSELDQYHFAVVSLEAQLEMAEASVEQAKAALQQSEANLGYTDITSPVDGIVIDRKIDRGQTLAAQFQTPELFIVAPDMRSKMHVFASVDEADIGLIREAQQEDRPVHFTVAAYPDDLFEGKIEEIRMSSTTTQNVVTYPVIVSAANPDLKLMPGMTANISFELAVRKDVLKIPNEALRFYPTAEQVHPEDRRVLEGASNPAADSQDQLGASDSLLSASEKAEAHRARSRRHVWIAEGAQLRAVEVVIGLSDYKYSELISGDLKSGDKLVTGLKPKDGVF